MDAGTNGGGHLDEGTIHAWLDDALDAASAARVEAHVAECAHCSAAVAEARGLIAGASRIVRALDDEGEAGMAAPTPWGRPSNSEARGPLSRMLHVTPARATIAATLLVALGLTLTLPRRGAREPVPTDTASAPMAGAPRAALSRDSLLNSAIQRNIAAAQAPRTVERRATPSMAVPQRTDESFTATDTVAPLKVAEGRAAETLARTSRAAVADQSGVAAPVPVMKEPAVAAAAAKPMVSARAAGALECYRLESPVAGAVWGGVPLPAIVQITPSVDDSARGPASVASVNSRSDVTRAAWRRLAGDSLQLDLRRIGYAGRIVLGGDDSARQGTMRSGINQMMLESVVVTGTAEPSEPANAPAKKVAKRVARAAGAVSARADSAAPAAPSVPTLPGEPMAVSAQRVSCY